MMFCWRWSLSHWVFVYLDLFFFVWVQWFAKCICIIFLDKGTLRKRTRKQGGEECQHIMFFLVLVSSGAKWCEGLYFRDPFWHHLGDFGRHFGTSWAPRGSQNLFFLAPSRTKISNKKTIAKKGASPTIFLRHFGAIWAILGAIWAILGAIWAPAGRQGAPKIKFFGTKSH